MVRRVGFGNSKPKTASTKSGAEIATAVMQLVFWSIVIIAAVFYILVIDDGWIAESDNGLLVYILPVLATWSWLAGLRKLIRAIGKPDGT